jgi:gliding motility-associated-like protein
MRFKWLFFLLLTSAGLTGYSQDVEFHINSQFLPGKDILKVKRDFRDVYLWVLAKNNEVYRINSTTLAVDDYTGAFAAYNGMQFIDIAGRSQDTVFIATNSTNVIEYKKGIIKVIGAADGISTPTNSVGIPKVQTFGSDTHTAIIGSDKGLYNYDMLNEKITLSSYILSSKVYEATYRDLAYKDSSVTYPDWNGRKYVPIILKGGYSIFQQFMSESDTIGHSINTAYEAFYSIYGYDDFVDYSALFWGTRNGMFQVNANESYFISRPYAHYLDGISVNKITTIFGLTAFGDGGQYGYPGLIKQTMLIGTDQGLYFSSSIYQNFSAQMLGIRQVNLFHFDELGNIVINDICVNTASQATPICDDGVWVAAENGLYLLKPDYGKYLTATLINAIQFAGQDPAVSSQQICSDGSITATINTSAYNGNTIQWYKDGVELPGESNKTFKINLAGNYSAVLYDPCENIHLNSNTLNVSVITTPVVTLNYPDKSYYCAGSSTTYTVDANPNFLYRWYKDGVLNGNVTNSINVTQSGKYKVEVSACSGTWVASKEIEAVFVILPLPTIKADKASYCTGESATLSTSTPTDPAYTINWSRDGIILNGNTNEETLTTNMPGNYSVNIISNNSTCSAMSVPLPVIFNPLPTISLEKIVNTTLCSGQTVDLQATFSSGTVKCSTGETSGHISVKSPGDYTATVTSSSGCTDNATINVQFFSNPVLTLQDATLCQFTKQQVTLKAPAGFAKYLWNGVPGENSFTTGTLGRVELTVIDNNGCTASQTINITSYCAEIKFANTFTPNGDGVNDTWVIAGLDNGTTVKVYNRAGVMVFNSVGYSKPWDGSYNGQKLPKGTYYYIIVAKDSTQILSGWVTIIY